MSECLSKLALTRRDLFVVHWSGSRKPQTYSFRPERKASNGSAIIDSRHDPIERSAHAAYMSQRCRLWALYFETDGIPGRRAQCGLPSKAAGVGQR